MAEQTYHSEKSHSVLLPAIIEELLVNTRASRSDLVAIAISAGPGSYTGLRIGLSAAKGLCFALQIPLISVDTLDALIEAASGWVDQGSLIAPMIDARRMEVYTKVVTREGEKLLQLQPLIVDQNTFRDIRDRKIYLLGSGASKCQGIIDHPDLQIVPFQHPSAVYVGKIGWRKYQNHQFEDLAYYEPNYLKEFQTKKSTNKLLG